ncbi:MAG: MoxR family ATPase [Anaerolineaceae bacterium]|nr:MoxR family ATPase [Anaerolineaceae bacterium]
MTIDVQSLFNTITKLKDNLGKVIIGKDRSIDLVIVGLLCQGHLLIDDVPGVGKTVLARSLAKSIDCEFKRIQFTPDMLPSDLTGVSIYNQKNNEFEFKSGPLFAQIVLADEINRATPKTQSALLEVMEERQITVDGISYTLEAPFMVLATQNPIEYEGTFPLPEAQLDRFLMRFRMGYPSLTTEINILSMQQLSHPIDSISSVLNLADIRVAQEQIKQVHISDAVKRYIVEISRATREHEDVYLGASPRGSLGLLRTAQARAILEQREYVIPDDVKDLAIPVLAHRVVVQPSARIQEIKPETIIEEILKTVPVPMQS